MGFLPSGSSVVRANQNTAISDTELKALRSVATLLIELLISRLIRDESSSKSQP
jgi:hypothetical protein